MQNNGDCKNAKFYITKVPVAILRERSDVCAPVVSTSYYTESLELFERQGEWIRVTTSDGYPGWMQQEEILACDQPYPSVESVFVTRLQGLVYGVMDTIYGPILSLPQGARLERIDASHARWVEVRLPEGSRAYIQKGDVALQEPVLHRSTLMSYAEEHYLGIPYFWGGRTSFGFDCSGLVQRLYERVGIGLPRDARDQIADPRLHEVTEYQPGDLIFFGPSGHQIHHVGLFLKEDRFLHASVQENQPWIHISPLSSPLWNGSRGYRKILRLCY